MFLYATDVYGDKHMKHGIVQESDMACKSWFEYNATD